MSGHIPDVPRSLVEEARAGDEAALRSLVETVYPLVRRWALIHLGEPADADDLTQDVLVRMIRSLGGFRGTSGFKTWLYALTKNAATDRRRRRDRRTRLAEAMSATPERLPAPSEDASRMVERKELRLILDGFFGELPTRQREAFELVELEGLTANEAAELLGVEAVSVRAHLFKARRRLRSLILESRPELTEEMG